MIANAFTRVIGDSGGAGPSGDGSGGGASAHQGSGTPKLHVNDFVLVVTATAASIKAPTANTNAVMATTLPVIPVAEPEAAGDSEGEFIIVHSHVPDGELQDNYARRPRTLTLIKSISSFAVTPSSMCVSSNLAINSDIVVPLPQRGSMSVYKDHERITVRSRDQKRQR